MVNFNSLLTSLLCTTTEFALTKGYTLGPYGGATNDDSDEDSEEDSEETDDGDTINYGVRYLWPVLFSVFAALIFGVVYSCTKKNKCAPRSTRNESSPGGAANRNPDNEGMNFTNSAFDGNGAGMLSDFPGSSFGEGIEMVPPPYCEKPPDYEDIYRNEEQNTSDTNVDHLPAYTPPGVEPLTPVESDVNYTPIGFENMDSPRSDVNLAATQIPNITHGEPLQAASTECTDSEDL